MADTESVNLPTPEEPELPRPDIDELLQREGFAPTVPVRVIGPTRTQNAPARSGPAFNFPTGAANARVLGYDPRRARMVIIGDQPWKYSRTASGEGLLVPQSVPLELTHCDEFWAKQSGGTAATLAVWTEIYGD